MDWLVGGFGGLKRHDLDEIKALLDELLMTKHSPKKTMACHSQPIFYDSSCPMKMYKTCTFCLVVVNISIPCGSHNSLLLAPLH